MEADPQHVVVWLLESSNCEFRSCCAILWQLTTAMCSLLFSVTSFFAFSHVFLGGRFSGEKPVEGKPQAHRSWLGAEVV